MGSKELIIMGDEEERKKKKTNKEKKRRESTWSLPPPHSTPSPLFFFDPFLLGGAVVVPQLPLFIFHSCFFRYTYISNASHFIIQSFIPNFGIMFFIYQTQKTYEYQKFSLKFVQISVFGKKP